MATRALALRRGAPFNRGIVALLAAVAIWGVTMVITKSALETVGPFTILAIRFLVGFLCLVPFAWKRGYRLGLSLKPMMIGFGIAGIVLHNGLETWGLNYTSAGSGALVIAAGPAIIAIMSVLFLKEIVSRLQIIGIGLSILGVIVVTNAGVTGAGNAEPLGNLMVFGGVIAWGVYTVQGKRMVSNLSALVITTAGMGASLLFLVPMAAAEISVQGAPTFTLSSSLGILYLGVLASAVAYALWNTALNHVDASSAGPYVNMVPVIGLLAALAVGEPTNTTQLAGGLIVGIGLWLSETARIRSRLISKPVL